jgi:hypothetical protein
MFTLGNRSPWLEVGDLSDVISLSLVIYLLGIHMDIGIKIIIVEFLWHFL